MNNGVKPLVHLVYLTLERYSDEAHPLTHADIVEKMKEWGYDCERKSVGRALATLRALGHDIASSKKGSYLVSRPLEKGELTLLIDSVLCSRHLNGVHTADLIEKISKLGGENFYTSLPEVSFDHAGKSGNYQFLYNIEELNAAIASGKKVKFYYNKFGADLKLHPTKSLKHLVNPYRLLLHNQKYYLAGSVDKYGTLTFFRVDKMTEVEVLNETSKPMPEEWRGSGWMETLTTLPYLYTDKPEHIVLCCDDTMIDELVDWFGFEFTVEKREKGKMIVSLTSSPTAMLYWTLQYGSRVKVLEPESLKRNLLVELKKILTQYTVPAPVELPPDKEA